MKETKKQPENTNAGSGMASEASEIGIIKIHENVISSIVRKTACSIEGVTRLAGSSLVENIAGLVGSKKVHDRAITVDIDGATVAVEIKVHALYNISIPALASEIQNSIATKVEEITGMTVSQVNVIIQELEDPEEIASEEADEE